MNMFKSNGGFTLVELIVVIAILAILAGVAVPAYSGYISKAQEANDLTALDSLKTAVVFEVMENDPEATVSQINVTVGENGAYTVYVEGDTSKTVTTTDYVATLTFKSDNTKAEWKASTGKWVLSK